MRMIDGCWLYMVAIGYKVIVVLAWGEVGGSGWLYVVFVGYPRYILV